MPGFGPSPEDYAQDMRELKLEQRAEAAEAERDELKQTLSQYTIDRATALALAERTQAENRAAAQALIQEFGAPGPETLAETVARAIRELRRFRRERDELRKLRW